MSEKKDYNIETWLVKDLAGEQVTVRADSWVCSGNGLEFFVNEDTVASFSGWMSYRRVDDKPRSWWRRFLANKH